MNKEATSRDILNTFTLIGAVISIILVLATIV